MFGAPIAIRRCETGQEVLDNARAILERRQRLFAAPVLPPRFAPKLTPIPEPIIVELTPYVPAKPLTFIPLDEAKPFHSVREIQLAVSEISGVRLIDMLSQRRAVEVVRPRQLAMALAKRLTLKSLPEIGRRFAGKDHTTVLHAVRRMEPVIVAAEKQIPPGGTSVFRWAQLTWNLIATTALANYGTAAARGRA